MDNWVIRAGKAAEGTVQSEVVSEQEISRWALFDGHGKERPGKGGSYTSRSKRKDGS